MRETGSVQATILSGVEGQYRFERRVYLTILGQCTLMGPTVAGRILAMRKVGDGQALAQPHFITVLGDVSIMCPTVAAEYVHARELLSNGALTLAEWDRVSGELDRAEASPSGVTLLGGFNNAKLPPEEDEIESLALHRHVGGIPQDALEILKLGIGQRFGQRRATIRRSLV